MLDKLTKVNFEAAMETPFRLHLVPEGLCEMRIIEVKSVVSSTGDADWGVPEEGVRRESFSVVFGGPQEPALWQGMYKLEHPDMGVIDGLFLVPVGQDQNGRYYEAIFN